MADEQPFQAHLRNKSAKEPYAKESGTAQWSRLRAHPAVRLLERPVAAQTKRINS